MSASSRSETTVSMAYPALPASPTLTNPDMILPYESNSYDDYDAVDSRRYSNVPPSPLDLWKDSRQPAMNFSFGLPLHSSVGQITPTTPIIYGNGTMLSDIGEVTEVESTVDVDTETEDMPQRQGYNKGLNLLSSPTFGFQASHSYINSRAKVGTHERKVSTESVSTVTSQPQAAEMDFDDGVSMDDSNFQGDDEESIIDETYQHKPNLLPRSFDDHEADAETDAESIINGDEDENISAALSRRAELILANAKQRLNTMEGNLSRARSSLYVAPSASFHSMNTLSRNSSTASLNERLASQAGGQRHRQILTARIPIKTSGHSRVQSENALPSPMYTAPLAARSSSALALPMNSEDIALQKSQSSETVREDARGGSRGYYTSPSLRTSPSFHSPPTTFGTFKENESPYANGRLSHRNSTASLISIGDQSGSRCGSSLQVQGLRDQMEDLKGRISSLRNRAKEDSMRRRSHQSLRSSSPYGAAEQWYTSASGYKDGGLSANAGVAHVPWNKHGRIAEDDDSEADGPVNNGAEVKQDQPIADATHDESNSLEDESALSTPVQRLSLASGDHQATQEHELVEEKAVEQPKDHDDADSDDDDAASLYHDSMQHIISHEDREDAFDYEHFFLHSAMGTIGRRRDSFSSEDSVETTRGPIVSDNSGNRISYGHSRQMSTDTLSTVATFQTANESGDSDIVDDGELQETAETAVETEIALPSSPVIGRPPTSSSARRFLESTSSPRGYSPAEISPPSSSGNGQFAKRDLTHGHRPSVSSFNSAGTARSFPLVNKPKIQSQIKTYTPEPGATAHSRSGSIGLGDLFDESGLLSPQLAEGLGRDDQILVKRLIISLEKCLQVLQEAGRSGYEARLFRRRLDAARRILDGQEALV